MKNPASLAQHSGFSLSPALIMKTAALALTLLFLATGCAGGLGKQTVVVKHYPTCYQPVTDLRADAKALDARVAQGALGGAVGGAILGLLASDGKIEGALIGAATGAVIGASVAFLATKDLQEKAADERYAAYAQYMEEDFNTLDNATKAARTTAQCYSQEYDKLEKEYKAGKIGTEEMRERLTEIRNGTADAQEILRHFKDTSTANMKVYADIQREEATRTANKASSTQRKSLSNAVAKQEQVMTESQAAEGECSNVYAKADSLLSAIS